MTGVALMELRGDILVSGGVAWPTATQLGPGIAVYRKMSLALRYWRPGEALVLVRTDVIPAPRRQWQAYYRSLPGATIVRIYLPQQHWEMRDAVAARYGVPVDREPGIWREKEE
jgi:hypothetical protein